MLLKPTVVDFNEEELMTKLRSEILDKLSHDMTSMQTELGSIKGE